MLKLRWPATCRSCGSALAAGTRVEWDPRTHLVTCVGCARATSQPLGAATSEPLTRPRVVDPGSPGASAQREYLRRRHNREARTRRRHPLIGGALLALSREPQHESAFRRGGLGEASVARMLERRTAKGPAQMLHDRRMPRGRGNIDHLAVAPTGVYVIDAKAIRGSVRVARPLLGAPRLLVNRRNRRNLVDGLERQVLVVREILAGIARADVPVHGVLCFTEADLPLFGCEIRGYRLRHPRGTARALNKQGALGEQAIATLVRELAQALPPA
jgi:hypothetical protein